MKKNGATKRKREAEVDDWQPARHPPRVVHALRTGLQQLSVAVTDSVIGREEQLQDVLAFFTEQRHNPTLQLYGMPGTGKTLVVKNALQRLTVAHSSIFLNGYVMQSETEALTLLWQHLALERLGQNVGDVSAEAAAQQIEQRFRKGWGKKGGKEVPLCIIVLDEMDRWCDRSGKTLFRLVDWLLLDHAHCRLITIQNAMELPVHVDARTRSRLNTIARIVFPAYTAAQLEKILLQRIGSIRPPLFSPGAVQYATKQIAASNGDVRRLLQTAAAAVHSLLLQSDPLPKENLTEGLVQLRSLYSILRNVMHDQFQDFVNAETSALSLIMMAAVTRETAARLAAGESRCVPLERLWQLIEAAFNKHGAAFGVRPGCELCAMLLYRQLSDLALVRCVDVLVDGEELSVAQCTHLEFALARGSPRQRVEVVMVQPSHVVQALLEMHPGRGEQLRRILAGSHH